jgi:hypothetical protein
MPHTQRTLDSCVWCFDGLLPWVQLFTLISLSLLHCSCTRPPTHTPTRPPPCCHPQPPPTTSQHHYWYNSPPHAFSLNCRQRHSRSTPTHITGHTQHSSNKPITKFAAFTSPGNPSEFTVVTGKAANGIESGSSFGHMIHKLGVTYGDNHADL